MMTGDLTKATALRIAERRLIRLGWNHGPEKIGEVAADIIAAMERKLSPKEPQE